MTEIANCPLCGADASIFRLDNDPVTFSHCGMQANSVELWNGYAAAMELAKAEVAFDKAHDVSDDRLENAVNAMADVVLEKLHRVLEVLK